MRSKSSRSTIRFPNAAIRNGCAASATTIPSAKNGWFLDQNFLLPALTIAQLYRCRWQVELFFRWIKQHLRIKAFYGTSENAVKTQVWIAISVYVLVAIIKKRLHLGSESVLHSTDSQPLAFRQNAHPASSLSL